MVYIQRYTILTARRAVQDPCQQNARVRALVCQEVMLKWPPPQYSLRADLGMTESFLTYVTEKSLFWELFLRLKTENQDETMWFKPHFQPFFSVVYGRGGGNTGKHRTFSFCFPDENVLITGVGCQCEHVTDEEGSGSGRILTKGSSLSKILVLS